MTTYPTVPEIVRRIQETALALAPIRQYLASDVGHNQTATGGPGPAIAAPSVELDGVTVTVSLWSSDPMYLGTFDRTAETQMTQVTIQARHDNKPEAAPTAAVDLPVAEQIGWVRFVLGDLADYAYRLLSDTSQLRVRPAIFVVFRDAAAPRLAPTDFDWLLLCGGRRAYPEKIVPDDKALRHHLLQHGDMVKADRVMRPRASEPVAWAHEFVSELTAVFADMLGRMDWGRSFTFDEVILHGHYRVVVRYTWHLTAGDAAYVFDIDLAGVRAERLRDFDDARAKSAARSIGRKPFEKPVFRSSTVIGGVIRVNFGTSIRAETE